MELDSTQVPQSRNAHNKMHSFELVEYEASLQRLGGDKQLFVEFIDIFMSDSPKMIEEIRDAIEKSDCAQLERSAHAIKGLISNFGAKACCESALAFEMAGRQGNLEGIEDELPAFLNLYEKLCAELSCLAHDVEGGTV